MSKKESKKARVTSGGKGKAKQQSKLQKNGKAQTPDSNPPENVEAPARTPVVLDNTLPVHGMPIGATGKVRTEGSKAKIDARYGRGVWRPQDFKTWGQKRLAVMSALVRYGADSIDSARSTAQLAKDAHILRATAGAGKPAGWHVRHYLSPLSSATVYGNALPVRVAQNVPGQRGYSWYITPVGVAMVKKALAEHAPEQQDALLQPLARESLAKLL